MMWLLLAVLPLWFLIIATPPAADKPRPLIHAPNNDPRRRVDLIHTDDLADLYKFLLSEPSGLLLFIPRICRGVPFFPIPGGHPCLKG